MINFPIVCSNDAFIAWVRRVIHSALAVDRMDIAAYNFPCYLLLVAVVVGWLTSCMGKCFHWTRRVVVVTTSTFPSDCFVE